MSDEPSPKKTADDPSAQPNDETFVMRTSLASQMDRVYARFMQHYTPFGFQSSRESLTFYPVPYKPEDDDQLLLQQPWRITLELNTGDRRGVMGIDLHGDVILGRGDSRPGRIILDLEPYGAHDLGVSREHAMLRPTGRRLFVIDQGSTNGTTVNGAPSGRGIATALKDDDMLSLGSMVLMVRILKRPDSADGS